MNSREFQELDLSTLNRILELIHKLTGISMNESRKILIQGRLRPRARELGLSSYEQYLNYLNSNKNEIQEFVNLVTTNETSFFRTQRVWDFFLKDFLPSWTAANPKKTLRIWSAASSSGEEVYTIGICCEEHRLKNVGFNYQILGTDISSEVIAIAEKAKYSGRSIEHFKISNKQLFDKYLRPEENCFLVTSEVRSRIKFNLHNLYNVPAERNCYDIVFLRNVLIYFKPVDQEKVLLNISKSLISNGTLVIGESESLGSLNTPFKYKLALVYEKVESKIGQ